MKAGLLLKHNIEALLRARHQQQKDLAQWCHRSEAWLSAALKQEGRGIPVKYLDRIADFFGIATYQLLQPGITPLMERRSQKQRRSGRDRRISNLRLAEGAAPTLTVSLEPEEVAAVQLRRLLDARDRQKVDELLALLDPRKKRRRGTPPTESAGATAT